MTISPELGTALSVLAGVLVREVLSLVGGLVKKLEAFLNGLKDKLDNLFS